MKGKQTKNSNQNKLSKKEVLERRRFMLKWTTIITITIIVVAAIIAGFLIAYG